MARRKASDLENQMSLMDMMASESPEYTEEGPEELLDPGEDTGDGAGQTDKPFKLVANKTTKAKANISTQALSVVKAVYADTVETNWEELFDGFDRLYAITFSSGIEFVNRVINKFSYAEVVFGCEKIIASDTGDDALHEIVTKFPDMFVYADEDRIALRSEWQHDDKKLPMAYFDFGYSAADIKQLCAAAKKHCTTQNEQLPSCANRVE